MIWIYLASGVLALLVTVLVGGWFHLRHSICAAEEAVGRVDLDEVPALRDECVRVFREAFGEVLDLDDFEGSAQLLSGRLDDSESLKKAFAKDDFYWYFVLPVGAFMGELLRVHLNGAWRESQLGGLEIVIPISESGGESGEEVDDGAQTFPFHKVIKQVTCGDPGDIYAYFKSSQQLDKILDELEDRDG